MHHALRELDNRHVWHPFTPMSAYCDESAPIIVGGDGFELIDADGNRYLDGISSLWCNVHGHRVRQIDHAVREQLDCIAHTTLLGLSSAPPIELAAELVRRTPAGLNKVFYSDSGSTAVEAALKIAYQYRQQRNGRRSRIEGPATQDDRGLETRDEGQRTKDITPAFVRLSGAYHGDTIGSVSVGGMPMFHGAYRDLLFSCIEVPSPVALRTPPGFDRAGYLQHCFDELERTIVEQARRIVAFVIEPIVQGAAGILVHPPGYLRRVRELTAERGIPLIADEVATGFGRTGRMFACEHEDVQPDILCLAKGLTGGYLPLAATLATDEIYNAFLGEPAAGRTFFHGHTYTGNPLGCAAALASLRLFDESCVLDNVGANAGRLSQSLAKIADHPHVGEIRQRGVMVGIELVSERETMTPFNAELRMGHRVTLAARRRGVVIRPLGDVVVLMPAPAMPAECIDRLCAAAIESIREATTGFESTP